MTAKEFLDASSGVDVFLSRVKELEGFYPKAYWDSGQWSIGHGTKSFKGEEIDKDEAERRLKAELLTHAKSIDSAANKVGLNLTEGQRFGLTSFDFNTGAGKKLIESSNGDIAEIRRRLPSWNKLDKGDKEPSPGLVNRRTAELEMFDASGPVSQEPPDEIAIDATGTKPTPAEVRRAFPTRPIASTFLDQSATDFLDAPYWTEGTEIHFDPRRQRQGLISARNDGIIDDAFFEERMKTAKDVEKAAYERRRLEIQAGENPEFQAVMHGVGRGSAMTLGGLGGAAAGAAVAPLAGPAAPFVPIITGVAGMVGATAAYDAVYKQFAEWDQSYGNVLAASQLRPGYDAAGQLAFVAAQLPTSAINMAKAVATVAGVEGAVKAAKFGAKAIGVGAAAGAGTDIAFQTAAQFLDEDAPPYSPESTAESAILGALLSGVFVKGKRYSLKDLYGISERKMAGKPITAEESAAIDAAGRAGAEASKEGKVVSVKVEQASAMGRPEVTRPTVTIEPTRARIGGAQEQFEAITPSQSTVATTPASSFAPPAVISSQASRPAVGVVEGAAPAEIALAEPEVLSDMPAGAGDVSGALNSAQVAGIQGNREALTQLEGKFPFLKNDIGQAYGKGRRIGREQGRSLPDEEWAAPEVLSDMPSPVSQPPKEVEFVPNADSGDAAEAAKTGPILVLSADGKHNYANVQLKGLDNIKTIEMPELVAIAKELTGNTPEIRKMRASLGQFVAAGSGQIRIHPGIATDPSVMAKVLAHEIGHLADYLPDKTMKRGNLIGRIASLNSHLQKVNFGIKEKDIRAELMDVTQWWKPWDEATSPGWYNAYRKSGKELYADAISVLFNSPADLKSKAPTFYNAFFANLDKKPAVKQAFFEIQDLLRKGEAAVLSKRSQGLRKGFGGAEERFLTDMVKRREQHLSTRGLIDLFKEQLYDRYNPATSRQGKAEKGGAIVAREHDLRKVFDEHPLADNLIYTWVSDVFKSIVKPLEAAGMSIEDIGEFLFFNRVIADRAGLANPGGHNPDTARKGLERMKLGLGQQKYKELEAAAQIFHGMVYQTVKEMADEGMISQKVFSDVIEPNRKSYVAFRPIDHVEDYVPAGIYKGIGSFSDVENPFFTTVLKTIAMRRAIQHHRAVKATVGFMREHFPSEIWPAEQTFDGRRNIPKEPKDKSRGLLELREDGKWKGYDVPKDIARMFDNIDFAEQSAVIRVLNYVFKKGFYNAWVRYNPIFQLVYSPIRDAQRFYVNMPPIGKSQRNLGIIKLANEYMKALPLSANRMTGKMDPMIREMYENMAIATPYDSFARDLTRGDAFESILQRFHVLPHEEQGAWRTNNLIRPVLATMRGIEQAGEILNAAPKVAAYKILTRDLGWDTGDAASYVRNKIGMGNYLRKGRHAFAANSILPFWNIATQTLSEDLKLMGGKDPHKSAASWWFKWALVGGAYSIITALARNGVLGDEAKKLYEDASDYDFTNYAIIPLGKVSGGMFGEKTLIMRVPQDEMHRITNGLLKKFIEQIIKHAKHEQVRPMFNDLLTLGSYTGGQLPGINPLISMSSKWGQFSAGLNPYDTRTGRFVMTGTEHATGDIRPMFGMMWDESGAGNFFRYNPDSDSLTEAVISNAPVIQRIFKVTDRGKMEQQFEDVEQASTERAKIRARFPDNAVRLAGEFNILKRIGEQRRTPQQQERYVLLRDWYYKIYTPTVDAALAIEGAGENAQPTIDSLKVSSEVWEK